MTIDSNPAPRLRVTWHGKSVVGCVRTNNEDSLWAASLEGGEATEEAPEDLTAGVSPVGRPGTILAVADGLGGAKAGEVASDMAVSILNAEMNKRVDALAEDLAPLTHVG